MNASSYVRHLSRDVLLILVAITEEMYVLLMFGLPRPPHHPFYDGNRLTGRILNILYMVPKELLDISVLSLSRFITQNRADDYHHLQAVRNTGDWEPWLLYLLTSVK